MAQGATLDYAGRSPKPPLAVGVRWRLSVMMFLQFAVWGGYFVVWNVYLEKLGFRGTQIGSLYGTMALGAIVAMMVAGQLADRVMASEYLMAIFHLAGAGLLYAMSQIHDYNTLWWVSLAFALVYNPTLAIANSISFANIPDATRDFPTLRVLGTMGWIAASMSVDWVLGRGADATNRPLIMSAILSAVLGVFSLALPHTPPSGKKSGALPFLRAFKLVADPGFGVFFGISFVITIALAFYYGFASVFLKDIHIKAVATTMSLGQWSELGFLLALPFALKRLGMKWVLGVGMAAWAVRYGLFALGHPLVLVLIGVAMHGVCFDFFLAAGFIHTDNKAPASIRASAQSLFSFLVYGVGMWLGNEISGRVVDLFTVDKITNWRHVWAVPAVGAAVCLVLFLALWRDKPGKLEDEPTDAAIETAAAIAPEA
ncbi:MAG TPA: MFS transporter [Tepidisphaeraceae bacterium]|jgi:nucleoside transporter